MLDGYVVLARNKRTGKYTGVIKASSRMVITTTISTTVFFTFFPSSMDSLLTRVRDWVKEMKSLVYFDEFDRVYELKVFRMNRRSCPVVIGRPSSDPKKYFKTSLESKKINGTEKTYCLSFPFVLK